MKKDIGLYIHIPFCKKKCNYCDFVSFSDKDSLIEKYKEAIIKEIKNKDLSKYKINTIYIGGGTPSILDSKCISDIINEVKEYISDNAEITIEINPGTADEEKLKKYKEIGINRLSIGLQSTDNEILKEIGRIHTFEEFLKIYSLARKLGFSNINVDLMLGLPSQTIEILEESVRKIIKLNPEHISIYSLILEENTKMWDMVNKGILKLPSEDIERKMYWKVKNMLENNGYIHYEISNFAKKGYESRHNSDCWEQKEYIGVGLAAHSYLNQIRFSNTSNLEEYINNINSGDFDKNITINETQTDEDTKKEYMLLGLRKIDGVSISKYKNKFGENPVFSYRQELEKLVKENLLEIDGDNIKLTNKGLDLANLVWEEFV